MRSTYMDTYTQLIQAWKPKHFAHLQYCFKHCLSFFEDSFEYQGEKAGGIMIDGKLYMQADIVNILAEYYEDKSSDYQSNVGDTIYLFFTDLVEDDVDILSEIEEEVA